jgi:hypothetical protein
MCIAFWACQAGAAICFQDDFNGMADQAIDAYDADYTVTAQNIDGTGDVRLDASGTAVRVILSEGNDAGNESVRASNDPDFIDTTVTHSEYLYGAFDISYQSMGADPENRLYLLLDAVYAERTNTLQLGLQGGGGTVLLMARNASSTATGSAVTAGQSHRVYFRYKPYEQGSWVGGSDSLDVVVDATAEADFASGMSVSASGNPQSLASDATFTFAALGAENFSGGGWVRSNVDGTIDNVIIAQSFEEVVPEPGSAVILIFGGLIVIARRRGR